MLNWHLFYQLLNLLTVWPTCQCVTIKRTESKVRQMVIMFDCLICYESNQVNCAYKYSILNMTDSRQLVCLVRWQNSFSSLLEDIWQHWPGTARQFCLETRDNKPWIILHSSDWWIINCITLTRQSLSISVSSIPPVQSVVVTSIFVIGFFPTCQLQLNDLIISFNLPQYSERCHIPETDLWKPLRLVLTCKTSGWLKLDQLRWLY